MHFVGKNLACVSWFPVKHLYISLWRGDQPLPFLTVFFFWEVVGWLAEFFSEILLYRITAMLHASSTSHYKKIYWRNKKLKAKNINGSCLREK